MKHKLILVYSWAIRTIFYFVPDLPVTMRIRGFFYGLVMKKCGKDFQVANNALLKGIHNFIIGDNVFIGNNTIIMGSGKLELENQVMVAPGTVIVTGNHTSFDDSFRFGPIKVGDILIKRGSWIGANCTIAIGTIIPENSVLGANSFVNKEFQKTNSLYAGVPARYIKEL